MRISYIVTAGILAGGLLLQGLIVSSDPASAHHRGEETYLALGDSVAVGVGAADPAEGGYAARFHQFLTDGEVDPDGDKNSGIYGGNETHHQGKHYRNRHRRHHELQLMNLAVEGETSATFITSGQLGAALAAIGDEASEVELVTLDIGGNDLRPLIAPGGPCNPAGAACPGALAAALGAFAANYSVIVGGLTGAMGEDAEDVMVMTYYNPFNGTPAVELKGLTDLALLGADGAIDCAALGVPERAAQVGLNDLIACIGDTLGATVVDTYPLPIVAPDLVHPDDAGHELIAGAFIQGLEG